MNVHPKHKYTHKLLLEKYFLCDSQNQILPQYTSQFNLCLICAVYLGTLLNQYFNQNNYTDGI